MENLEQQMVKKCLDWVDNEITEDKLILLHKKDVQDFHQRIYLAAWNGENEYGLKGKTYTFVYLMRVFTMGDNIALSVDYENTVLMEDFVGILPEIGKILVKKSN